MRKKKGERECSNGSNEKQLARNNDGYNSLGKGQETRKKESKKERKKERKRTDVKIRIMTSPNV